MSKLIASGETSIKPRARLIRTIGDEIISSEAVAILELVKNAYDADATRVLVRFTGLEKGKGTIEIIDNGHGMSLQTIENSWMEPATSNKKSNKLSPNKRRVLGEKGIGRFASAKLGQELELVTRQQDSDVETRVLFDWSKFKDDSAYISDIEILWEQVPSSEISSKGSLALLNKHFAAKLSPSELSHGTLLRMSPLSSDWDGEALKDLATKLKRLVFPRFNRKMKEDFQIVLEAPQYADSGIVEYPDIYDRPHYHILGSISKTGALKMRFCWDIRVVAGKQNSSKGERLIRRRVKNRELDCGSFQFELRIWERDTAIVKDLATVYASTMKDIRAYFDLVSGVSIYRDGFRVLPYGEEGNDWLSLDKRRIQNPSQKISNNQVNGYILISAHRNKDLVDQSNREGLTRNAAYIDFFDSMMVVITEIEAMRYTIKKSAEIRVEPKPTPGIFTDFNLDSVRAYVQEKYPDDTVLNALVTETNDDFEIRKQRVQDVLSRYRRLNTLGEFADKILHDGQSPLSSIVSQSQLAIKDIENPKKEFTSLKESIHTRFIKILNHSAFIKELFNLLKPFSGRKPKKPEEYMLEELIRDVTALLHNDFEKGNIDLIISETSTFLTIDEADFKRIILNLLTNAIYWVNNSTPLPKGEKPTIAIDVWKEKNAAKVLIADTGDGVPIEYHEVIFDPYFSRKTDGIGLGLTIAGEIVAEYDGIIELVQEEILRGAHFLITLHSRS